MHKSLLPAYSSKIEQAFDLSIARLLSIMSAPLPLPNNPTDNKET